MFDKVAPTVSAIDHRNRRPDLRFMAQLLKKGQCRPRQARLQTIVISQEAWGIESGFLTPALTIKRSSVGTAVAGRIDNGYRPGKAVSRY